MRDPLDIIEYAESKGKNVPNYKYGPGFTAQGYYQITNPTWRDNAKAAGVDLSKYPTAMTAPKEVQRAVAEQIFKTRGFQPWEAVKHLRGQEANYRPGISAPAPTTATAKDIHDFQKRLLEKYPELRVTSGYRDPATNARVGGARNSQHTHGTAIDVAMRGIDEARQREIVEYARSLGARGLGYYPSNQSAHFDLRKGAPAAWGGNYSHTSLPQTPGWFQEIAKQHRGGGGGATAVAQSTPPQSTPAQPATGVLSDQPDPWRQLADSLKEQQAAEQQQALQQQQQQAAVQAALPPQAPPPSAPAAPPPPPIDYASLLLPRLRRGLLADDSLGMLGVA